MQFIEFRRCEDMLLKLALLAPSVQLGSNESAADTAQAVTETATQVAARATSSPLTTLGMIAYIIVIVALFYFFIIRPQKKREKELQDMQQAVKVGDWVMTSSGFYGKVVDVTEQVFIVEFGTNKSVCIPVKKSEIMGNKEPNLTNKPSEDDNEKK
jgi:preprotein translocase subunit YajC